MKKSMFLLSLCALFLLSPLPSQAEQPENPMQLNTWMLNAGIGLGSIYNVDANLSSGFAYKIALQRGMWEAGPGVITLGLETGMVFNSIVVHPTVLTSETIRYTQFNLAPRSSWHYGWDVAGLDTYAGLSMGLGFLAITNNNTKLRFYGDFHIGGSYFFSEEFGVNVETAYGTNTIFQVGIVYKF
jgi:hypothetical protein